MATTVTIVSKTDTQVSIMVTKTSADMAEIRIGPGFNYNDIVTNSVTYQRVSGGAGSYNVTFTDLNSNTQYGIVAYIFGGGESEISPVVDGTLPPPPLLTKNATSVSQTSAQITTATAADGGYYAKNIQYSLDNGSTWTTGATVASGTVTTSNIAISGLSADTSYTANLRINTTAGIVPCGDVSFKTASTDMKSDLLCSVNGSATSVNELRGSYQGNATKIIKVYGSVNNQARRIF